MKYEIIFDPGALREFDKLPKTAQRRLGEVIDGLAEEPRPQRQNLFPRGLDNLGQKFPRELFWRIV